MSETYPLFLQAKSIIDILLNDKTLVKKIQMFINTERAIVSKDYVNSYLEIDDMISEKIKTEKTRIVIMKSDGAYFFDNTFEDFGVLGIQNHNNRPEVISSLNHFYGNGVLLCYANKYPRIIKKMVLEGYGVASRSSSTNKKFQCYVAKTYSDKADPLSDKADPLSKNVFTLRVSIPVDSLLDKRSLQSNKEVERPRKIINKKQPKAWLKTGVVTQDDLIEAVNFMLASLLGSNPTVSS